MNETFLGMGGTQWAMFGAGVAAILAGCGSAIGITSASTVISGVLSEDDTKFGQLLPLAAMPGTQGIYGFIVAVLVMVFFDLLGGRVDLPAEAGVAIFMACLPTGFLGLVTAIYQGRTAAASAGIIAAGKRAPALVFPALVETYAIFALIITILMLLSLQPAFGS
ncbi:MAG: V-type ATP synthase subunit K [Coriobacteriia bacterium]|nr:V-type ATP synthase subunit K [Coriobacteriia bacterium]